MPRSNKRSPCTDKAFIQAVFAFKFKQVIIYLNKGYDVRSFPENKFLDLCRSTHPRKAYMAAIIFSGGYVPPLSPELAQILFRSDNEEMRFMIDVALDRLLLDEASLQEPPPRETSLREASLQEPPLRDASLRGSSLQEPPLRGPSLREAYLREASLREASLQEPPLVLFVDENYETYLNKFTVL